MNEPEKSHGPAWWVWVRTHVFLMPPGVPLNYSKKREKKEQARKAKKSQQGQADALDAWTQPLTPEPAPQRNSSAPPAGASAGSWAMENEKTFGAALAKVLRIALIVTLVFVCIVGLRQIIFPSQATTVVQEVESETFPTAAGAEVATRQVAAYLTIDPADAALAARQQAMALDSPNGSGDRLDSASVTGKQSVSDLAVVRVAQLDGGRARALVTGTITDYTADGEAWTAGEPRPVAAEVLLTADDTGTVSVLGRPALIATTPGPIATSPAEGAQHDTTVGGATQDAAESFFSSYGEDESVTASVAPGADIAGLAGGAEFSSLRGWTVYEGGESTRTALATVAWTLPSGIELTQTYTLTLSSVSADEAGGWQISAISGGGTTE
ncbi:conjugal transfer protein [uncultured Brachybacterium sp.]|uniref:conjugal transfer protein n=1 Tax=uncultured Brachybacterium sp. TaxID=189680 RepID=UPI002610A075|nr:conjugal transfer protein [uncultured Brachybacterium sp.]